MLIKELVARYVGPQGALHERGSRLDEAQVPPGVRVHHDKSERHETADAVSTVDAADANTDTAVAPVAGDLVVVNVPVGPGLPEYVDTDLPVGATMVLLFEVEVTELPVDRLLAALAVAKLQVVEAAVLSGTPTATVAVVATRTDELIAPSPALAHNLEPGSHEGSAALRRLLGEHTLEGLVQPARERALRAQVGAAEARLAEVTAELEAFRVDRQAHEAVLVRDLAKARKEADAERKEADAERKRMQTLRSSKAFKVASRLAQASGVARKVIRRPGSGKPRD